MTDLLEIAGLSVDYRVRLAGRQRRIRAVDNVDLIVRRGEILGLVGESGCGKSTLARALVGLERPTVGQIRLEGSVLAPVRSAQLRKRIQMVFQDPGSSLDPRQTVLATLVAPLRVHRLVDQADEVKRAHELLELVELPGRLLDAKPGSLSGGQKQRVAIARALAVEPDVLVADEAVAALDASATGAILNLISDLRETLGLTVVFISHDLSVVNGLCDRVAVMYLGQIVETGPAQEVLRGPRHPYLRSLLAAVPRVGAALTAPPMEGDEPPSVLEPPTGCRFHPRCPIAIAECQDHDPVLVQYGTSSVACHLVSQ